MRGALIVVVLQLCLSLASAAQDRRQVAQGGRFFDLPDAPSASMVEPVAENNRRSTEVLASDPYRPLTKHQKWEHFLRRTYSPATFIGAGEDTVYTKATGGFVYCCGIGSWGEQYAATVADKETRQFFGDFLFPTLLKQDPRYFPKRKGNLFGRAWYAATRVLVTRNDNGNQAFNYSEILGVAFSKAMCNSYYPDRQRGAWETGNRIVATFQSDATSNLITEFWPEIERMARGLTPKSIRRAEKRLPLPDASSQY
ncbi:MAG: hypothetical protein ACXVZX_07320 [Terriglobales bacterium]